MKNEISLSLNDNIIIIALLKSLKIRVLSEILFQEIFEGFMFYLI